MLKIATNLYLLIIKQQFWLHSCVNVEKGFWKANKHFYCIVRNTHKVGRKGKEIRGGRGVHQ